MKLREKLAAFIILCLSGAVQAAPVPELQSRPGAGRTLFLDFDGTADIPAYAATGVAMSYIHGIVADAYATYGVNVTTVPTPGAVTAVIGGGMGTHDFHLSPNTVYVFPWMYDGSLTTVGETIARKAQALQGVSGQSFADLVATLGQGNDREGGLIDGEGVLDSPDDIDTFRIRGPRVIWSDGNGLHKPVISVYDANGVLVPPVLNGPDGEEWVNWVGEGEYTVSVSSPKTGDALVDVGRYFLDIDDPDYDLYPEAMEIPEPSSVLLAVGAIVLLRRRPQ